MVSDYLDVEKIYLKQQIYDPQEDSLLLREQVGLHAKGRVLDMGCGSGILTLEAAKNYKVWQVVAADISPLAVSVFRKQIKFMKISKIIVAQSDLFENIKGRFGTIIFNPPYLPTDKNNPDIALDGGKTGVELIRKFLLQAKTFLEKSGSILLLFSNKSGNGLSTISALCKRTGYNLKILSNKKLPFFEELYVAELKLMAKLEVFSRGKRGIIYKQGNYCIKEKNPESKVDTLSNEARWLKILNNVGIGPAFISYKNGKLKRNFVKGKPLGDFIRIADHAATVKVIRQILLQCRKMDELGINKTELNNPYKDIIVAKGNMAVLIDFERCKKTTNPKNVTQFMQYLYRNQDELNKKGILFDKTKLIDLGKSYKKNQGILIFQKILSCI